MSSVPHTLKGTTNTSESDSHICHLSPASTLHSLQSKRAAAYVDQVKLNWKKKRETQQQKKQLQKKSRPPAACACCSHPSEDKQLIYIHLAPGSSAALNSHFDGLPSGGGDSGRAPRCVGGGLLCEQEGEIKKLHWHFESSQSTFLLWEANLVSLSWGRHPALRRSIYRRRAVRGAE